MSASGRFRTCTFIELEEYLLKDVTGDTWLSYAPTSESDAIETAEALSATQPDWAPFTAWKRTTTEILLTPKATR